MAKRNGIEFTFPFSLLSQMSLKFEIKNDQCVPIESTSTALIQPQKDGQTNKTAHFNTELCKEVNDFLIEHPEAESCFKPNINNKISAIFGKYMGQYPMANLQGRGGGFGGFYPTVESFLYSNDVGGVDGPFKQSTRKSLGLSPVITGHKLLQDCYSQRLGPFMNDPAIWEERTEAISGSESEGKGTIPQ